MIIKTNMRIWSEKIDVIINVKVMDDVITRARTNVVL